MAPVEKLPANVRPVGIGAGAFLLGAAVGAALKPGVGAAAFFVAATGAMLLFAFRLYEGRAVEQEERITGLEAHRRAVEAENARLETLHDSITRTMASALEGVPAADDHLSRVADIAVALGHEVGMDVDALAGLRTAALLHDIGRLDVPRHIWAKMGSLSPEEWDEVHGYPAQGARRLEPVAYPWPVTAMVRGQQEHWDGSGYPDGLSGAAIPLGARVLAVADAYHAMRSDRPYRPALEHRAAMEAISRSAGRRYDPGVVEALQRLATRGEFMDLLDPNRVTQK